MSSRQFLWSWNVAWIAIGIALIFLVTACDNGDANEPSADPNDEYSTSCDEHGNLVYLTEDDKNATPNIFVLEGACDSER